MLYAITKAVLSGAIIAAASEVAKRSPAIGAVILSLPLVSLLDFVRLWRDTADKEAIAALSQSTFWFVLPTLPMFLVFPALLRNGFAFWCALAISCGLTVGLYLLAAWLLPKFGIAFMSHTGPLWVTSGHRKRGSESPLLRHLGTAGIERRRS
jgi:hypothetical protein